MPNTPNDSLNAPLNLSQPGNMLVAVIFYSPLFIAFVITCLSFVFQNFKGILYLLFLVVAIFIRSFSMGNISFFKRYNEEPPSPNQKPICSAIKYSEYENNTFTLFFVVFSFIYFCGPMILSGIINYWLMSAFIFYYFLDLFTRVYVTKCGLKFSMILVDSIIFGMGTASLALFLLYSTSNQKYLFFNETSSTKDMCSMPSKQTFKCSVYKNGELIGETNR
jgi:hypothetical protein